MFKTAQVGLLVALAMSTQAVEAVAPKTSYEIKREINRERRATVKARDLDRKQKRKNKRQW